MSLSANIRSLEAAVKRLEVAAGKGQKNCPRCRYDLRHSWHDPKMPEMREEDLIKTKCEFCRSEYTISLARVPEGDRDIYRAFYSYAPEDFYTDPKAHALNLLLQYQPAEKKEQRQQAASGGKNKNDPSSRTREHTSRPV